VIHRVMKRGTTFPYSGYCSATPFSQARVSNEVSAPFGRIKKAGRERS
jgi:hypothetical protein